MRAHLVGGGLASMAAAAYLIREAGVMGKDIAIYERADHTGGSLSVFGDSETGYIYPGGRVFEAHYQCVLDLFSVIPSRLDSNISIKDDVLDFNAKFGWNNKARLIDEQGHIVPQGRMGIGFRDQLDLLRLLLTPDRKLQGKRIEDCVSKEFMNSPFWYIWSSIMAFRPRHSAIEMRRYMIRFMHLLPELWSMTFILRTRINQQQAIVEPLVSWLSGQGVHFNTGCSVDDVTLQEEGSRLTATAILLERDGEHVVVELGEGDLLFITNGSHVANLTTGKMDSPPPPEPEGDPWKLWRTLAHKHRFLGNPGVVADHQEDSTWVSFTVTDRGRRYAERMEVLTGQEAGRGGLVTLRGSNWLLTLTRFHYPNIIDQPEDAFVWWGYGIYPERPGNFVKKPMLECSGAEIMWEVLGHLRFEQDRDDILGSSICIPCRMPYAGSVFLWRQLSDRPLVVPTGSANLAFIGQFCEQPGDVPFTMEYSVRSAWAAVHALTGKGRRPPGVYRGYLDPRVLLRNALALLR